MSRCRACLEPAPLHSPDEQSLIVRSGECRADWLYRSLTVPWFGDLAVVWDERRRDVRPKVVDRWGKDQTGQS